ncbi:type II toxin-antitoxin system PemK/MazF family toxin [Microbacter sp. GSS18]|nr:type II toxin-antitoxin system PemK/MazF family toxin [Microbacter sp. GSS18]
MSDALPLLRRGHIVLVNLDPAVGSEAAKTRPAIVVSNNTANASALRSDRGVITVVPLTSNVARVHGFQVLVDPESSGLTRTSKAQAERVRTVSIARVSAVTGWLGAEQMGAVDAALRLHLSL